jgi:hypothetical protein
MADNAGFCYCTDFESNCLLIGRKKVDYRNIKIEYFFFNCTSLCKLHTHLGYTSVRFFSEAVLNLNCHFYNLFPSVSCLFGMFTLTFKHAILTHVFWEADNVKSISTNYKSSLVQHLCSKTPLWNYIEWRGFGLIRNTSVITVSKLHTTWGNIHMCFISQAVEMIIASLCNSQSGNTIAFKFTCRV